MTWLICRKYLIGQRTSALMMDPSPATGGVGIEGQNAPRDDGHGRAVWLIQAGRNKDNKHVDVRLRNSEFGGQRVREAREQSWNGS